MRVLVSSVDTSRDNTEALGVKCEIGVSPRRYAARGRRLISGCGCGN
jgi:hypothetical protein